MSKQDPIRPDPDNRFARLSKTAAFWMLMVIMFLVAMQVMGGEGETAVELDFTELKSQLASGNVHEVTFIAQRLEGELRAPIAREGEEYIRFVSTLPPESAADLLTELQARDVIIKAEASDVGWGTYPVSYTHLTLPTILLV